MLDEKIVIGVTGMPGAGKDSIRNVALKMNFDVVIMGDEIREEAKRRKLDPTPENLGTIMLRIREEEEPAAVAKRCIPKIVEAKARVVVVEGIRSLQEVDEFKKSFPNFTLIAVHASTETRFRRLFKRKRSDDPISCETFMDRDSREVSIGIKKAIKAADHIIMNEGTKNQLKRRTHEVFDQVLRKWM